MSSRIIRVSIVVGGAGLAVLLSLGFVVWVGRELGPESFGPFSTGLSLLYFCRFAANPIHATVTLLTAECSSLGQLAKISVLSRLLSVRTSGIALGTILVTIVWGAPIANLFNFPSITFLVIVLGAAYLTVLCSIPRGILRGLKRFNEYTLSMILEALVRIAAGLAILAWVANATAAFSAFIIALATIYIWISMRVNSLLATTAITPATAPAFASIILPLFPLMLTSAAIQNVDMLMAQLVLAPGDAGSYGAAFAISRISSAIGIPILTMLLPAVASANAESLSTGKPLLKACGGYITLSLIPILAFLWVPNEIITLLFGDSFRSSAPLLFGLVLARALSHLCHMMVLTSVILGKHLALWAYSGGLAAEILALTIWHESPSQIVKVVLVIQACMLLVVIGIIVYNHLSAQD